MNNTSQKQIQANRENGKKGGIKTNEGKEISKYNAMKHGLLSEQVLLDEENGNALLNMENKFREEFQPETEMEFLLVDKIVSDIWRLKRILSLEKNNVFYFSEEETGLRADIDVFFRYETMLERNIYKALHELERLQAKRNGERLPLPIAIDVDISGETENGFVS